MGLPKRHRGQDGVLLAVTGLEYWLSSVEHKYYTLPGKMGKVAHGVLV